MPELLCLRQDPCSPFSLSTCADSTYLCDGEHLHRFSIGRSVILSQNDKVASRPAKIMGVGSCRVVSERASKGGEVGRDGLGNASGIHSRDFAVGSRDHPVRADERATTEVEAGVILGSKVRYMSGLKLPIGLKHPGPCPTPRVPTCRDTCQGQEPGTAFSPLTILWL